MICKFLITCNMKFFLMTYDWILSLGDERSREYFMWVGEKKDNTHLQESGALKVAGMVADALKGL